MKCTHMRKKFHSRCTVLYVAPAPRRLELMERRDVVLLCVGLFEKSISCVPSELGAITVVGNM
jgi:hypothetical protein